MNDLQITLAVLTLVLMLLASVLTVPVSGFRRVLGNISYFAGVTCMFLTLLVGV
jgi:hypothetical protein